MSKRESESTLPHLASPYHHANPKPPDLSISSFNRGCPPTVPRQLPVRGTSAPFSRIQMAPTDHSSVTGRHNVFCQRFDEYHETIPKALYGASETEKTDVPKSCNGGDFDKGGDKEPDSSLPSFPSSTGMRSKSAPPKNSVKEKRVDATITLEKATRKELAGGLPKERQQKSMDDDDNVLAELSPGEKQENCWKQEVNFEAESSSELNKGKNLKDQDNVARAKKKLPPDQNAEDFEERVCFDSLVKDLKQAHLDNKLIEELESLPLQESMMVEIKTHAHSQKTEEFLRSTIELWKGLKEGSSLLQQQDHGTNSEENTKSSVEEEEPIKGLADGFEQRNPLLEKRNAMNLAHHFSQKKGLTNEILTNIYSCYREQVLHKSSSVPFSQSKDLKNLHLSLQTKDAEMSLKNSLASRAATNQAKMDKHGEEFPTLLPGIDQHLSELGAGDFYNRGLNKDPVENSFYFSTSSFGSSPSIWARSTTSTHDFADWLLNSLVSAALENRGAKLACTKTGEYSYNDGTRCEDSMKNCKTGVYVSNMSHNSSQKLETEDVNRRALKCAVKEKADDEEPEKRQGEPVSIKDLKTSVAPSPQKVLAGDEGIAPNYHHVTAETEKRKKQKSKLKQANEKKKNRKHGNSSRRKRNFPEKKGKGNKADSPRGLAQDFVQSKSHPKQTRQDFEDDVGQKNYPVASSLQKNNGSRRCSQKEASQKNMKNDWRKKTCKKGREKLLLRKECAFQMLKEEKMNKTGFEPWYQEEDLLPFKAPKLDILAAEVTMVTASDGAGGDSGRSGQGGNSANQKQNSSGHQGSGARPKENRNRGSEDGEDGDGEDRRPTRRDVPNSLVLGADMVSGRDSSRPGFVPPRDFKRPRKKQHGSINNEQLCHCLGLASQGMGPLLHARAEVKELDRCVTLCLHDTATVVSPAPEDLACCVCAILHSLLSHFSGNAHGAACTMCLQLLTLVQSHVQLCLHNPSPQDNGDLASNLCYKIRSAALFADSPDAVPSAKVWGKLRKYMSAVLGPVLVLDVGLEPEESEPTAVNRHQQEDPPRPSASDQHSLGQRSEQEHAGNASEFLPVFSPGSSVSGEGLRLSGAQGPYDFPKPGVLPSAIAGTLEQGHGLDHGQGQGQGHSAVHAVTMPTQRSSLQRRPSTRVVPQKTIPEEPNSLQSPAAAPASPGREEEHEAPSSPAGLVYEAREIETPDDGDDIMKYIHSFARENENMRPGTGDDLTATQPTYGGLGTVSMPESRDRLIRVEQNMSVAMKPFGVPGIGEVVYGTRQHLLRVIRNWSQEKDECKASGRCHYQLREEGVILHTFKKELKILYTRYQKHQQWERLIHLGNGVTGKCHLCIDRTSNFKFCCKKVHILQYEDLEVDIMSELRHPNIVGFYGALRHGEKIYIFAEFIDGGSLSALIKEQLSVGRRLSHWTALNYFRQLLHVLIYLQSMGVLHEDIKGDNILLRNGTTEIVLADFGAAQRIPHDHTPPDRFPTGSPAHWSPEKAASEGHGFPSDLWASACVLIHMLSGSPPWIERFSNAAILNYIIWSNPPPMEDVPAEVKESVRELISLCLVKDQGGRPMARQIISHRAFQLLDQSGSLFSMAQPPCGTGSEMPTASASYNSLRASSGAIAKSPPYHHKSSASGDSKNDATSSDTSESSSASLSVTATENLLQTTSTSAQNAGDAEIAGTNTEGSTQLTSVSTGPHSPNGSQARPDNENSARGYPAPTQNSPSRALPSGQREGLVSQSKAEENMPAEEVAENPVLCHPEPVPDVPEHGLMRSGGQAAGQSRTVGQEDPAGSLASSLGGRAGIGSSTTPNPGSVGTAEPSPSRGEGGSVTTGGAAAPDAPHQTRYPALTEEDLQISPAVHTLSVIPEDVEEGSITPSLYHSGEIREGGSMSSADSVLWNYMEDQLSSVPGSQGEFSLNHQPILQLFDPPPGVEGSLDRAQLFPNLLPKFELLSLSDSTSTLVSGKNPLLSSEEYPSSSQRPMYPQATPRPWFAGASSLDPHKYHQQDQHLLKPPEMPDHGFGQAPSSDRPGMASARPGTSANQQDHDIIQSAKQKTVRQESSEDLEHIPSGDLYGSGPSSNAQGFQDALQYKQEQEKWEGAVGGERAQQQPVPASVAKARSPCMARKHPNLRLDVKTPSKPSSGRDSGRVEGRRISQHSAPPDSGYGTHTHPQGGDGADGAFHFAAGVSPMTPSPLSAKIADGRRRSRTESGSSVSTPKSSTYDKQEQEWTTLQLQTPGFDVLLSEEPLIASGSEHSNHHLSLLFDEQEEGEVTDQEATSMLSMLQEGITNHQVAGTRLTFINVASEVLFAMMISGRSKSWKELAGTFRGPIYDAGFQHFKLILPDGTTPVEYFSSYDPSITSVMVIEVAEDETEIFSICWCKNHLVF